VRDLQTANERESRDILTAAENFGQLALKVTDVGLEAVTYLILRERRWWLFFLTS